MESQNYESVAENTSYELRMELIAAKLKLFLNSEDGITKTYHNHNTVELDAIELELKNQ